MRSIEASLRRKATPGHRGFIVHPDRRNERDRLACRRSRHPFVEG
jgi:hypothetical protein